MNILTATNVSKSFADHKALNQVDLIIPKGSIFGLLGPNGAGKTTFIRIVNQIIEQDSGEIMIENEPLKPSHIHEIGYLPEERGLYKKMKVGEQLLYLARLKGVEKHTAIQKIRDWLQRFELMEWKNKNVEDLSKGMQQKIQFIATVIHEPKLIILDEPFSGFDPINANLIKDEILKLRENGASIIFSTHRMESVEELCDYIALINKSQKILDGPKKDIKAQFRTNIFEIDHIGDLSLQIEGAEIIESNALGDNRYQTLVKLSGTLGPNQLLSIAINQCEIHGFIEKIPSINEIFISKVNEEKQS